MEAQFRQYDKTLLIQLEGALTDPALQQISQLIDTLAAKINNVVCDLQRARVDGVAMVALVKLKKQCERGKMRFVLVSPTLPGADRKTLAEGVELIGGMEGGRLIEVLALESKLKQAREQGDEGRQELLKRLGIADPSASVDPALRALEDKAAQLRQLFKTLSSEILQLEGDTEIRMPGADNEGAVRVAETKRRALDTIRGSGMLDD